MLEDRYHKLQVIHQPLSEYSKYKRLDTLPQQSAKIEQGVENLLELTR